MAQGTVGRGWTLVWRHQRILRWVFIVNFILGLFATIPVRTALGPILGHSLHSSQMVNGFDVLAFVEVIRTPSFTMGAYVMGSVLFSAIFFVFMLFITGGILVAYREDRKLTTGEFFEASGAYFWRMFRLMLMSLPLVAISGFVYSVAFGISSTFASEKAAFGMTMTGLAITVILILIIRLWFDVAQVRAVAQNEHRMFRNLIRSVSIMGKSMWRLLWMYFRISVVAWLLLWAGLWLWTKIPAQRFTLSWLLLELVLIVQIFARLWQRAASVTWYGLYAVEHPTEVVDYVSPHPIEIAEPVAPLQAAEHALLEPEPAPLPSDSNPQAGS